LVAQHGRKLHQMDVKSASLNDDIKEEYFITQPQGFEVKKQEHKVCKLVMDLYGLKQAPWDGYSKIHDYLRKVGF